MALKVWEEYLPGHSLIRQPLLQTPGGMCQFAALSRHMDYELRIAFGRKNPAVHLPDLNLVDQDAMRIRYRRARRGNYKFEKLLEFAEEEGFPLWNGNMLRIDRYETRKFGVVRANDVVEYPLTEHERVEVLNGWLLAGTVMGTMTIYQDYNKKNEREYVGLGRIINFHAIVITGVKDTPNGYVFIYQDSRGPENGGLLGMGRNQARLGVLLHIFRVRLPADLPDVSV